uniref:Laminin, alpha 1 n=1 Tax=Dicentrarchus labrax TaxID=13489 RepID=A0A8P4KAE0_DICLA
SFGCTFYLFYFSITSMNELTILKQTESLFPAILNLASNAVISSNATCGDPEPEVYCKLVEHVPGRRIKNPHCPKCDANSILSSTNSICVCCSERHPITNAIDGTNQWWQSPSIKNGRQFHWITVTLDLKQVTTIFQVAYIIIKAANSPRPGNWILERSLDGVTFDPWQFYAISDSECLTRYNVTPRLGPPTYKRDTEVICTSYYSRLNPLEHGEIHTSLINGRPGADDLTSDLLNFTSARYIRLRLQRIRTLNADLMTLSARDPRDIDPIVTRRYYYSIKDISVGGMCICYGHAQSCPLDPVTKKLQCVCEHNTCGESCNKCCPGYHQQPWQPGTVSEGNTCEKCNCHNKAVDCFYNQTVSELSLSLNTHGVRQGGGVCMNCQQNTAGINCETCTAGNYRPAEVSPYSDSPCVQCNCDLRGSESSTCTRDSTQLGVSAGQCRCKEGFTGRQCDRCAFGFRDFPLCTQCECNLSGSINTDPCSPCTCKVNVMGAHCDLCKPGFYNLQDNHPLGCTDCFCFGVSDVCESSAWSTTQSLHTPSVINDNDLPIPGNASSGHAHQQVLSWEAPDSFLGNKVGYYFHCWSLFQPSVNRKLTVCLSVCLSLAGVLQRFPELLSFPTPTSTVLQSTNPRPLTSICLSLYLSVISLRSVSLDVADSGSVSGVQAVAVEMCECPWGYSGTSCEACLPGFYRVGGVLFGGNCMQCECNDHTIECDINGVCLGCTHNTTGPHCEHCLPGFYGDATEGTPDDCRLCPCPLTEPSNSFSPTCVLEASGQVSCDRCQDGYTGTKCERCASGFYGNPQVVGGVCVRCECNGNVDISKAGHCDTVTGDCLRCLGNTAGRHCEVCQPGYYGDALHAKDCQECGCDVSGALSSVCDVTTGQCLCRENVTGRTCNHCQSGFFGLQSGQGCQACGCSQSRSLSESCDAGGRCQCVEGVAGHKCDSCSRGYYGFHANGCTACICDHTGGNCDPETGDCICPAHTQGDTCDRCETGYWGHNPATGCQPCSCTAAGSSAPQCDLSNGQCRCREGFSGRSCDQCSPGYHGFPGCSVCGCDMAGTDEKFCNTTLGVCDCLHTGECVCKVGVSGQRCEECVSGWFALSADGCSQCFCSGLSSDCEEKGGLYRVPVSTNTHIYSTEYLRLAGPLYWRLPPQFEGHQLLSYGGLLSYIITFYAEDGLGLSNQEPQILIRGGTLRKLVIYTDMVAPGNGIRTQHDIRLTEHNWKYFNSVLDKSVSRADFLSVLSNIEYVIIKASYGTRLQQSRISNITMETAVDAELKEGSVVGGGVARLIESCVCPPGYSGLSCQECAAGFFRQSLSELSPHTQKSLFVRPCVQCRCNNHSESCDTETGECQGCQHHTSGPGCELCAPGYYGNISGSISDCSLCACPLRGNSFSPTCVSEGAFGDFRCTACQMGYEGRYCERCSVGYYGNPSVPGGMCSQCSCSGWGSLQPLCDALSGQCECKAGVKGRSCDQCEERHILQEGECVSCDDECTGVLLDDLEKIYNHFLSVNLSGVAMAPYHQLVLLQNQTTDAQVNAAAPGAPRCGSLQLAREAGHLNQTTEEEFSSANQTRLLGEVESMLETIRVVNLTAANTAANQELRCVFVCLYRLYNSKLEEAEHRTDRLMDRIKPLSMLGETLSRNLSDIRELIDQARRQAASIKVAVQADRDCVRSYRPQIESSNFNTLSLILKTSSPDNLLFYLSSNTTVDFLAVEMHDGKVSLAWDVGSGSTRLDFPGLDIANNRWTRINATRFGAHGSLSVHQLESESAPLPAVTATSRGPSRVLDIDRNTVIHIGGLGAHTQVTHIKCTGCLGEASLNERNIGLWNYNSREGECGGCFSSPQAEETSFHFDGSGFSLVQKSLRATSTSIVLLFKTLSPGGLLLYLASNNTRDFLSMELVEGRVRLTFDLGSGALILTSNRKYNTGVWYKITLQRSKRKGTTINIYTTTEVLEAESPGTASDLNRSDLDPIYIGGLPASRPIRRQVVSRSYVGCIKNVEIARSNFDLLRDAFGVRKGCVLEAVRSVSVLAGGFVQIAPRSLGQEVELFLSFSTNNQSGVVLAAFSDDPTHRQVRQTHTHTHLGSTTRRVMVVKPVGGSFSDGIKHSVIITINRKSLSMQVDEDHRKSVSLSPGGFSRLSPASFFIAGLPSEGGPHLPIRLQDVSRLFRGCIQHLVVGRGVELDSCLLEERDGGAVLPDDQDVEPTKDPAYLPVPPPTHLSCVPEAEPTFLLSAAHFSLSKHSHMTFIINPSTFCSNTLLSVFVLSVLVRLSVRSRALDGLILLLSDSKQMDFIVLRLTGGRLMMSADLGKGPASITSSVTVNDGKWHIMSRRLLSVSVDGSSPDSVSVKGNQLDVDNRLYLGGVPHTHTARRINVSSSFPGCIRGVSLNAAMLDLSKPVSLHDVTSCFTTEQTGSYFNGSGYAALMPEGYKVGSDVLVSLEFRTSQSEGVFLGISSAKVDAIGLEMINGQVVFNVNNGAGRVSVHSIGQMLCDGQWHRLLARKTKHTLSLSVDGRSYSTPNPYPQSTSAETNNPVYLGGYPVSVKQNCLSINSRFRGCLRNLQLVKSHLTDALNLSSAHFLLGVTPNSCPVA